MMFGLSCCQSVPMPDPPQSFPVWKFSNGTAVNASSKTEALDFLTSAQTNHYWASEIEPGMWDVQFDEYVTVERVPAKCALDAVQDARWYLQLDATAKKLLRG
jgi:hypothetical protein